MGARVLFSMTENQAAALRALERGEDGELHAYCAEGLARRGLVELQGARMYLTPIGLAAARLAGCIEAASRRLVDTLTLPLPLNPFEDDDGCPNDDDAGPLPRAEESAPSR